MENKSELALSLAAVCCLYSGDASLGLLRKSFNHHLNVLPGWEGSKMFTGSFFTSTVLLSSWPYLAIRLCGWKRNGHFRSLVKQLFIMNPH